MRMQPRWIWLAVIGLMIPCSVAIAGVPGPSPPPSPVSLPGGRFAFPRGMPRQGRWSS